MTTRSFANVNAFTDQDHELDAEWEEGFVKLPELPGGFELRAGRFLNRIGLQNSTHLHGWNFINSNLSTGTFLGEDGLITEGAELSWFREFDGGLIGFTASYGNAASHSHDEEGGHHDDDDDHHDGEDEDKDEDHHDEDEEGHGHNESLENAYFSDELLTARVILRLQQNDFHQHQFGLNGAWGENNYGSGEDSSLYSIDYTYTWRENGLEQGGREFSVGLEYFHRDVDWIHAENPANSGSDSHSGFMAQAQYRFADQWVAGLRYEHIDGESAGAEMEGDEIEYGFDVEERDRISLALTREFAVDEFDCYARLQYDYDDLDEGSENSVWLQFGLNFGPGEIR